MAGNNKEGIAMQSITLPITLVTAGGASIIALWLGLRAGRVRSGAKISIRMISTCPCLAAVMKGVDPTFVNTPPSR